MCIAVTVVKQQVCAYAWDVVAADPQTYAQHRVQGIIVNGCIRDSEDIGKMELGVKALATYPLKSSKRDPGLRDVPVSFAGAVPCIRSRIVTKYAFATSVCFGLVCVPACD